MIIGRPWDVSRRRKRQRNDGQEQLPRPLKTLRHQHPRHQLVPAPTKEDLDKINTEAKGITEVEVVVGLSQVGAVLVIIVANMGIGLMSVLTHRHPFRHRHRRLHRSHHHRHLHQQVVLRQ